MANLFLQMNIKKNCVKFLMYTLFLFCFLTHPSSYAQTRINVKGVWNMSVETSAGSGSPTFVLKHSTDSTLEGTYQGQLGETDIKGTLKGNKIYLSFEISGNLIEYNGIVEGENMKGTVKLGTMGEGSFIGIRKKV